MKRFLIVAAVFLSVSAAAEDKPTDKQTKILHDIYGWGAGQITGGADGTLYTVTNDSQGAGEGTLRKALESDKKLWIVFAKDMKITLDSPIQVKSHKTVDARGRKVTIDTHTVKNKDCHSKTNKISGFVINKQSNIVLLNLVFDDAYEPLDTDCEGSDAVSITDSTRIWIHHCTFARWADGAVDIHSDASASDLITVSWSLYHRVYQANLWGVARASFHHNVCDHVGLRCPDAQPLLGGSAPGHIHAYNNYVADWLQNGVLISKNSDLWDDHDMFAPKEAKGVYKIDGGCIERSGGKAFGEVTNWSSGCKVESSFKDGSIANSEDHRSKCESDSCWKELRDRLLHGDKNHPAAGATLPAP